MYGAMGWAREGWDGILGDKKGAGGMGRAMGRWEGRGRDGAVYGAMGRAREGWGGVCRPKTGNTTLYIYKLVSKKF